MDKFKVFEKKGNPEGRFSTVCEGIFKVFTFAGASQLKKIRQYLVDNFIDCIIQLPGNLFFGTSIATCIMVLKRSKADNRTLFIDASKEYIKITNNNKLTEENIGKLWTNLHPVRIIDYFARCVPYEEIAGKWLYSFGQQLCGAGRYQRND